MANFGPLTVEICWRVWCTQADFNGFRVLASTAATSIIGVQPKFARCLASPLYIHFWGFLSLTEFCHVQNSIRPSLAFSYIDTALQQRALAKLYGVVQGMELRNSRRGRHPYSAGRPSRLASAHISSLFFSRLLHFERFILIWAFLHLWGVQDSRILCSKIIQNSHYVQTNTMNHRIFGNIGYIFTRSVFRLGHGIRKK